MATRQGVVRAAREKERKRWETWSGTAEKRSECQIAESRSTEAEAGIAFAAELIL